MNSPTSVKSYEILNSSALNEKFEKQIRSYETIKNNAAVYRLHLSDGTTYDVKNYTMKPGAGEKSVMFFGVNICYTQLMDASLV